MEKHISKTLSNFYSHMYRKSLNKTIVCILVGSILIAVFCCRRPTKLYYYEGWVNCNTSLDTLLIRIDAERGAWAVHDTLTLWSGIEPFNKALCDSIGVRVSAIWTPSGKERPCSLSDLFPPFKIFKNKGSDTLYVFKDGKTLLFQIPDRMCE